jgi:hypothetical protein
MMRDLLKARQRAQDVLIVVEERDVHGEVRTRGVTSRVLCSGNHTKLYPTSGAERKIA